MKLAFYSLAAVLAVGLGIGLSVGRNDRHQQPAAQVQRPLVFVDKQKLVSLHPAWETLQEIRAALAQTGGTSRADTLRRVPPVVFSDLKPIPTLQPEVSRSELEADAERAALQALHQLELDKREALWMRLRSKRESLIRKAENDLAVEAREADAAAAETARAAESEYCPDRLKAQLKVAALKVAADVPEVAGAQTQAGLHSAQAELDTLNGVCQAETGRIKAVANAKIAATHDKALAEIDEQISREEEAEIRRIETGILQASSEVFSGVGPYDVPAVAPSAARPSAGDAEVSEAVNIAAVTGTADTTDIERLRSLAATLEVRIEKDLDRAVKAVAAEEGLRVTFERSKDGVRDETATFARLLRERAGRAFGPVLCELRGS